MLYKMRLLKKGSKSEMPDSARKECSNEKVDDNKSDLEFSLIMS